MSDPYRTFTMPSDPEQICDAQLLQGAAIRLRRLLRSVPDERHVREATLHLDRCVMVAMGGWHTEKKAR